MSTGLALLMLAAVADYTRETKENQKVLLSLPRTESDNNGSISYSSSHGSLFFAKKICPLCPAYSNFLSRKASQHCLVIYSACMALQCCGCRQRRTQDEALPENVKSRKSPRSRTNGCKTVHSLLTPEKKKQQLLVVHRLHGTFKLKNPEMSGESFQMLWKWMWFYTQNIEHFILGGLPASLTTVAR